MKIKFCLVVFFLLSNLGFSQNNLLEENHHKKVIKFSKGNQDSLLFYANKMKKSNNTIRKLYGLYSQANYYYNKKEYEKSKNLLYDILFTADLNDSINYINSELFVGETFKENIEIVKLNVYRRFFYIYKNKEDYEKAYSFLIKRKIIVDNLKTKNTYYFRNKISVDKSMATLKSMLGLNKEAIIILKKLNLEIESLNIEKKNIWFENFQLEKAYIKNRLGETYLKLYNISTKYADSADYSFLSALKLTNEIDSTNIEFKKNYYYRKIRVYQFKKEYNKMLSFINKNKLMIPLNDDSNLYVKSICFSGLNKNDSAIYYAKKYLKDSKKTITYNEKLIVVYNILTKNYYKINEIDSALKYSKLTLGETNKFKNERKKVSQKISKNELNSITQLNSIIISKKTGTIIKLNVTIALLFISIIGLYFYFLIRKIKTDKKFNALNEEYKNYLLNNKELTKSNYQINDKLTKEILMGLDAIESSTLYLNNDFNLYNLAKVLNTNTTYLSKTINNFKGKSFNNYLLQIRIDYLLKKIDAEPKFLKYSIKSLGEEIGYTNASSFTRAFKKYKKINPSDYIKSINNKKS